MIVPILLGLIVIVLIALIKEIVNPASSSLPPKVSGALPMLGNIISIVNPKDFFVKARAKYGDVYRMSLLGREWYIITGRNYFPQYFKAPESQVTLSEFTDMIFVNRSIYAYSGDRGKEREFANFSALRKSLSVRMDQAIGRVAARDIDRLPQEGILDLSDFAHRMVGHIISVTLYGIEDLPDKLFTQMTEYALIVGRTVAVGVICRPLAKYWLLPKVDKLRKQLQIELVPFVAAARADAANATPYLNFLFQNKFKFGDEERFATDHEISLFMLAIFFAAVANTGDALANMMLLMADHPEETTKLQENLREISLASAADSKLLQAWIDETARMSKGFLGSTRMVLEDFEVAGYLIPKGSMTMIDSFSEAIEQQELIDREVFKPERWLGPVKIDKNLNWGAGLHLCPGRSFAMSELRYSIHQVAQKLYFEPSSGPYADKGAFADAFLSFKKSYVVKYHKL